ncbi:MAG: mandelate racemase/muconate lactonizing enzyme family protein [Lacipirellulaceae bacterium]
MGVPSEMSYEARHTALKDFSEQLTSAWAGFHATGHPMEIGYDFQQQVLPTLLAGFNRDCQPHERMPKLASLVCCSPFDVALHDAYGKLHEVPVYSTYNRQYMNRDLSAFMQGASQNDNSGSANGESISFTGKYPEDYLSSNREDHLPVWHLVGGLDPLDRSQLNGQAVGDQEPEVLDEWISRDGLDCFKVKLRGNDEPWDYDRLVQVSRIAATQGDYVLTADFNCTVTEPDYVNRILDRLKEEQPTAYDSILYVEQPFPYDLEAHQIDVRSVSQRKPLLMDESAHSWEYVRLGRSLGWTGVALKTCKTQTGALLMHCWAKAHGMHVMVQDLTNPMLAQIPHVLLAAHAETMRGVESNAMQFYPQASVVEAKVHPGIYQRRNGQLDLTSIQGPGFGYRLDEIDRDLDEPVERSGSLS